MESCQVFVLGFIVLTALLCKPTKGLTVDMPPWTYLRDSVTLRCVGPAHTNLTFYKDGAEVNSSHQIQTSDSTVELMILSVSESDQGLYSCGINEETQSTQKELWVLGKSRSIKLTPSNSIIPEWGRVTLSCDVEGIQKYEWIRRSSVYDSQTEILTETRWPITVSRGGVYSCRGKYNLILTPQSNNVTIWETGLTLEMPSLYPFLRDSVTLRCVGPAHKYLYFYKDGVLLKEDMNHKFKRTSDSTVELIILSVSESDEAWYCCGISENTQYIQKGLWVFGQRRSIELTPSNYTIPDQGRVTLSCDVERFHKYQWIRCSSVYDSQMEILDVETSSISISHGGVYSCRGKDQFILSEESTAVTIRETVSNRAVVKREPDWTEIFCGESLTLRCEIEDEGNTEWTYEWRKTGVMLAPTTREYTINNVSESDRGVYSCRGVRAPYYTTQRSQETRLEVLSKAVPVLSVSPSWLSPGASVSLKCAVTAPSAGWRFYWYKAVPLSSGSYTYELLPGLTSGTEHDSFSVHNLTNTAGFVCRAARGRPEFYTEYSQPQFVWSGDSDSPVSPTVSPDRSQHLTSDPVSVSCESSSTDEEWRVQVFSHNRLSLQQCPSHTTGDKYKCDFNQTEETRAVFWCESGSGELTNAVNITVHNSVILVSPVLPVTEGLSVSLGCKLGQSALLSSVHFYKDGKLIQNGSETVFNIFSVSKSDEGFYKCEAHQTNPKQIWTSAESWISVKSVLKERSSSVLVMVMVGAVCVIVLLILLLLLLWRYRKTKDLCFMRSQETNQTSAEGHMTSNDHSSPPDDVTYSELELQNTHGRRNREQEDFCVYSNVMAHSAAAADVDVLYSQINHHKKGNAKEETKVKRTDSAADETLYSEVKRTPYMGQ